MKKSNRTLVCLSNETKEFTYGKSYDIYIKESNFEQGIEWKQYIYGDDGVDYFYHLSIYQDKFISIQEFREQQLNKILDNGIS